MGSDRNHQQKSAGVQLMEIDETVERKADESERCLETGAAEASSKVGGQRPPSGAGKARGDLILCCDGYGYRTGSSE